jgi:hypothetical protein
VAQKGESAEMAKCWGLGLGEKEVQWVSRRHCVNRTQAWEDHAFGVLADQLLYHHPASYHHLRALEVVEEVGCVVIGVKGSMTGSFG